VSMTGNIFKSAVLAGPERRRRRTPSEKLAIIAETHEPCVTVSLVARRHGIAPNQLFLWRRLASQGALAATQSEEPVVPASEYRSLQGQIRELQRLLGKKTMEAEILKEALKSRRAQKTIYCGRLRGRRTVRNEDRLPSAERRSFEHRR
jgi:transposase